MPLMPEVSHYCWCWGDAGYTPFRESSVSWQVVSLPVAVDVAFPSGAGELSGVGRDGVAYGDLPKCSCDPDLSCDPGFGNL